MILRKPALTAVYLAFGLAPALAQSPAAKTSAPVELGKYDAWTAYRVEGDKGRSCYIVTQPASSDPPAARRDPIYFFITHAPKNGRRNEISIRLGYPAKTPGAGALEVIGVEKFSLATHGEGAWMRESVKESAAVEALRKGKEMLIKATSRRGTNTSDRYSLNGIAKALGKIDQECQ